MESFPSFLVVTLGLLLTTILLSHLLLFITYNSIPHQLSDEQTSDLEIKMYMMHTKNTVNKLKNENF